MKKILLVFCFIEILFASSEVYPELVPIESEFVSEYTLIKTKIFIIETNNNLKEASAVVQTKYKKCDIEDFILDDVPLIKLRKTLGTLLLTLHCGSGGSTTGGGDGAPSTGSTDTNTWAYDAGQKGGHRAKRGSGQKGGQVLKNKY